MELTILTVIDEVRPHSNADRLEILEVAGFRCIVQKGKYKKGDKVVYIPTDTVLPDDDWAKEYKKYSPKRVKAIRLRGEWSEGIVVPIDVVLNNLNVSKYEEPIPQDLQSKGGLPFGIPKTDEVRLERIKENVMGKKFLTTLKIDGQSSTYGYNLETDEFFITSRGMNLKLDSHNNWTFINSKYGIQDKLVKFCKSEGVSLAIRGEIYGSGIQNRQNNPHSKGEKEVAFFSVWDIKEGKYLTKGSAFNILHKMGLPIIPVLDIVHITEDFVKQVEDGEHPDVKGYEGFVMVNDDLGTFKIINKEYDSKK